MADGFADRSLVRRARICACWLIACALSACASEARIRLLAPDDESAAPEMADAAPVAVPPVVQTEDEPPVTGGAAGDSAEPARPSPPTTNGATGIGEPAEVSVTQAQLALRYDFEGTGDVVRDRVGDQDARVLGNASLDGHGAVELDGHDDYVDMPNGVLSRESSVTIMAWLTWRGGYCWQRIFDFGSNDAGEDRVGNATTSLFLTPAACPNQQLLSMTERERVQEAVSTSVAFPVDRNTQVSLSIDGETGLVTLYVDGEQVGESVTAHPVADLQDVNNWLGRSQWVQDGFLRARYDELRIYSAALGPDEIAELYERGPDAP